MIVISGRAGKSIQCSDIIDGTVVAVKFIASLDQLVTFHGQIFIWYYPFPRGKYSILLASIHLVYNVRRCDKARLDFTHNVSSY